MLGFGCLALIAPRLSESSLLKAETFSIKSSKTSPVYKVIRNYIWIEQLMKLYTYKNSRFFQLWSSFLRLCEWIYFRASHHSFTVRVESFYLTWWKRIDIYVHFSYASKLLLLSSISLGIKRLIRPDSVRCICCSVFFLFCCWFVWIRFPFFDIGLVFPFFFSNFYQGQLCFNNFIIIIIVLVHLLCLL